MPKIIVNFVSKGWFAARHNRTNDSITITGPRGRLFRAVLRHELAHSYCLNINWLELAKQVKTIVVGRTPAGAELYIVALLNQLQQSAIEKQYNDAVIELKLESTIGDAIQQLKKANGIVMAHKLEYYLSKTTSGSEKLAMAIERAMNEAVANMAGFGTLEPHVRNIYESIKQYLPWQVITMVHVANAERIELAEIAEAVRLGAPKCA
ncbi:MAG: hypothetical protein QXE80_08805 [Pyrobaculum sp.]